MGHDRLHAVVAELHTLLDDIDDLDHEDREKLNAALGDIRTHLDPEQPDAEEGSLTAEVDEAYARLRARHPVLATGLQRLMDTLNQMGL